MKAQSAFEFLSTYGWAVFTALAIIAALMSFGFNDLRSQVPDSCHLGMEFVCLGATADARGVVLFEFSPSQRLHIEKLLCSYPNGNTISQNYTAYTDALLPNQNYILGCENMTQNLPTHKDKVQVKIIYRLNQTEALPRIADGEIVTFFREDDVDETQITISAD